VESGLIARETIKAAFGRPFSWPLGPFEVARHPKNRSHGARIRSQSRFSGLTGSESPRMNRALRQTVGPFDRERHVPDLKTETLPDNQTDCKVVRLGS